MFNYERFIHFTDVSIQNIAHPWILLDSSQRSAGAHIEIKGQSYEESKSQGFFWVITRLDFIFNSYPKWKDTITIQTWLDKPKGIFSVRNYRIINSSTQEVYAEGSGLWVLISATDKKPQRINSGIFDETAYHSDYPAYNSSPSSIKTTPEEYHSLSDEEFKVYYGDLDQNGHTNNVKYFEKIINQCYTSSHLQSKQVHKISINFINESFMDDIGVIKTSHLGDIFYHTILINNKEIFKTIIEWK